MVDHMRISGIGQDDKDIKQKYKDIRHTGFNSLYESLKTGKPVIGNLLNGSVTEPSQASTQL